MQVRLLCPSDVEIAHELMRQLGYDMPANELAGRIARVLDATMHYAAVAEEGSEVVGLVHAYARPALEKPTEAVVQSLIVEARARKRGVGRLLMASAEAWARTNGMTHLVLHTRTDRVDAHTFYEQLGYRQEATSNLMRKWLASA